MRKRFVIARARYNLWHAKCDDFKCVFTTLGIQLGWDGKSESCVNICFAYTKPIQIAFSLPVPLLIRVSMTSQRDKFTCCVCYHLIIIATTLPRFAAAAVPISWLTLWMVCCLNFMTMKQYHKVLWGERLSFHVSWMHVNSQRRAR